MSFYPRDITPLSMYEEMEWVGIEGKCDKCNRLFYVPVALENHSGKCPLCGPEYPDMGWVSIAPRMYNPLETLRHRVFMERMDKERADREKEREKALQATYKLCGP